MKKKIIIISSIGTILFPFRVHPFQKGFGLLEPKQEMVFIVNMVKNPPRVSSPLKLTILYEKIMYNVIKHMLVLKHFCRTEAEKYIMV